MKEDVDECLTFLPSSNKQHLQAAWTALLNAYHLYDCWKKDVVTQSALEIIDYYRLSRTSIYVGSLQLLDVAARELAAAVRLSSKRTPSVQQHQTERQKEEMR